MDGTATFALNGILNWNSQLIERYGNLGSRAIDQGFLAFISICFALVAMYLSFGLAKDGRAWFSRFFFVVMLALGTYGVTCVIASRDSSTRWDELQDTRLQELATNECTVVVASISDGTLRELEQGDVNSLRSICGDEPVLAAANSSDARLDLTFSTIRRR